ncbi:MAG: alpha-N-acetylglucosaminidase, partial [Tannerella sp.]|nr:alpha-N-acetylglucosaminidase [Tannerella sp.]
MKAGTSVDALIQRVSEGTAKNLRTEFVKGSASEGDFFEITNQGKDVLIQGNNPVSIATGFNWYLKYVAGIHIAWNNLRQPMPTQLPPVPHPIRQSTDLPLRYYLNYCTFSYSMAFWNWNRWEEELDWMAMHGVNMSLDLIGNAVVWRNLLEHLGYTKAEVNQFVAGPAFQAWWEMNNLEGWGGPNPDEWYAQQEALQKKILARMHALGIQPVLPGFAGMVPRNIGKKLGYEVADPGRWCTFPRPAFLRTDDPHFNDFAHLYYKEMEKLYGKAAYYAIDPFHEGGSTKGIDLTAAGHTIWAAMKKANPKAVWVIQAWQRNPREAMIGQLPTHDVLVLDLYSEKEPQWGDPQSA